MHIMVALEVNRSPRRSRQLYPPATGGAGPGVLKVYWLEVGGVTPAKSDYDAWGSKPQVLAALTMIDQLVSSGIPVPKSKVESFVHDKVKLVEIKAPPRGKSIFRLLAYREKDWDVFVAFAREKKTQSLPGNWKATAASRVKQALAEGGPL